MFLGDFENSQAFNDDWAKNSRNNDAQIKLNMTAQRELQKFDKRRESNGSIGTVKTQNKFIESELSFTYKTQSKKVSRIIRFSCMSTSNPKFKINFFHN